jgi:hypothetical protein
VDNDVVLVPPDIMVVLIAANVVQRAPDVDLFFNTPEDMTESDDRHC